MKKKIYQTIFFIIACVISAIGVYASNEDALEEYVENDKALLVCEYKDNIGIPKSRIYYITEDISENYKKGYWAAFIPDNKRLTPVIINRDFKTVGTFKEVFVDKKYVTYNDSKNYMTPSMENTFTCPSYAFFHKNDICYGNHQSCGSYFDNGPFYLTMSGGKSIFNIIDDYIAEKWNEMINSQDTMIQYFLDGFNVSENIEGWTRDKMIIMGVNVPFVDNYIAPAVSKKIRADKEKYDKLHEKAEQKNENDYKNGVISEEKYAEQKTNLVATTSSRVMSNNYEQGEYDKNDDKFNTNCANFASTLRLGGYAIFLVKIFLPLIIIVKTTLNIMPLITSGSASEFSKIGKKAAISLASAIIIFFIPTIVDVAFGLLSSFNEGTPNDINICRACVFDPYGDYCKMYAEK